ncbi:MAG: acyltransferase family protein, partial [Actinomycetota bacterium]
SQQAAVVGDVRAALLNLVNWRFVLEGASYADLDLVPSPVQHYWSLAIEEQFYLLFPVVALLALRWGPRALGWALGAAVAASVAAQLVLDDVDRVYFGTDTRAAELALGGLLALALPHLTRLSRPRPARLADVAGGVGLVATAVLWARVDQQDPGLYAGGLAVVGVVSGLAILGAVTGGGVARPLSARPLVELGRISYGVYLFHFPLYLVLTVGRLGLDPWPLLAVRVAATLFLAVASYHLVEHPIRRQRVLPGRASVVALAATAVVVGLVTIPAAQRSGAPEDELLAAGLDVVAIDPGPGAATVEGATAPSAPLLVLDPVPDDPAPPAAPSAPPASPPSAAPSAIRAPRVLVVGDSTGEANAAGLRRWGEETGRLEVASVTSPGCAVLHGPRFRVREGYEFEPQGCDRLLPAAAEQARALGVDAIVVFIGSSQLADWELPGETGWHHIGQPLMDQRYEPALAQAVASLSEAGVPVLWADVPVPEWDLDAFGALLGRPAPGVGPTPMNDPARAARLGDLDAAGLVGHLLVERWAYAELVEALEAEADAPPRPDGLHLSEDAMGDLAERGLYERLGEAYRAVAARAPQGAGGAAPHAWAVSSSG